jgi:hypothetical protein
MRVILAKNKTEIFDRSLPRTQMSLRQVRRLHARILRHFAKTDRFDHSKLTIRLRVKHNGKFIDFINFQQFSAWAKAQAYSLVDALELSYKYACVVQTANQADVLTMDANIILSDDGNNRCMIVSNNEDWAKYTHALVCTAVSETQLAPLARITRRIGFAIAVICLGLFAAKVFPFTSMGTAMLAVIFVVSSLIAGWPSTLPPFKQLFANKIDLSE